jgi:spore protease
MRLFNFGINHSWLDGLPILSKEENFQIDRRYGMNSIRTDLALEAKEISQKRYGSNIPGILTENEDIEDINISRVRIISEEGERNLGKPQGVYITLEMSDVQSRDPEYGEMVSRQLGKEINHMVKLGDKDSILVLGLGNWNITPDSLGPKTIEKLFVTRHILEYMPDQVDDRLRSVSAVAPGVLGITGIETGEIVRGVVEKVKPDLVIAIDALASQKASRIGSSIQITNTGINPGSGIGNKRTGLNKQTLGVETLAIGVPTVVYARTIGKDSLSMFVDVMRENAGVGSEILKILKQMDEDQMDILLDRILSQGFGDLVVTPKEVDTLIEFTSGIIADGLNIALHNDISFEEVKSYMA